MMLKRTVRRALACLLAACMLMTLLPVSALAEEDGGAVTVAAFEALDEQIGAQTVPYGTAREDLTLPGALRATLYTTAPDTETVEIGGVTWKLDEPYEGAAGTYVFTASAEGYVCADGVEWPVVTVTVEEQPALEPEPNSAPYEAALALFAALPTPEDVAEMTDGEKDALSAQLGAATDALFALPDEDYERFMAEHAAYLETVAALQDALSGGVEVMAGNPKVENEKIYANGMPITLADAGSGKTNVTYGSGTSLKSGDLSKYSIYGGGFNDSVTDNTQVIMYGGQVQYIYGGGRSKGATVTGNTNVIISGGTVQYQVIGGGGSVPTNGSSSVTISGGTIGGYVYGGGSSGAVRDNSSITITGGTLNQNVYGGGNTGTVNGSSSVTITGGTVAGDVFGGGLSGAVSGTKTVTVGGSAKIGSDTTGIVINGTGVTNGVNTFAIEPDLEADASIHVKLPAGFAKDTVIATGAVASDVAKITLVGDGISGHADWKPILIGTDIVVSDHTHNWATEWSHDSVQHWHECLSPNCPIESTNDKDGCANHSFASATCTQPTRCSVCGYESGDPLGHTLSYSASGNTITENCSRANDHSATATLGFTDGTPNLTYDGTAKTPGVALTFNGDWQGSKSYTTAYSNNTNAGTATAKVTIEGRTASVNFTIGQAQNSVSSFACENVVFGVTPNPSASAAFGTPAYTYCKTRDGAYGAWNISNGVGTWYVKAAVAATTNYAGAEATASFRVTEAAMAGISATGYSGTYDGAAHRITVSNVPSGATVYYSLTDGSDWSTTHPEIKNATPGTTVYYKVSKVNYADVTGSATVTIAQAPVTPPDITAKTYTGSKLTADVPASTLYTVTTNDGGVDAGKYNVVLALTDSTNYKWEDGGSNPLTLTFTISKATNEWTTPPALSGWTYGSTPGTPAGAAKFGPVKVEYKLKTAEDGDYTTTRPIAAGTYTARFSVEATVSYTELTETAEFTISQKEVDLTWNDAGETTYTGEPRNVTATATGLVEGDICDVTVKDGGKTDAGNYTAEATGLSNNNYKLPATDTTQGYKIKPAPLTVSVKNDLTISKTYDGNTNVESADVADGLEITGLQHGETATASGTWAYDTAHAGTDKTVTVTDVSITYGTAQVSNYSFTAEKLTTTGEITRKLITPAIAIAGGPWTYTGSAVTPAYTVKDGTTELTAGDYTAVFSDNVDAGTAKLKITAKTGGNYNFPEKTETFSIACKQIAAVWGDVSSWEYDGKSHAPTATAKTDVTGETVMLAVTGGQENYQATAYTATASIASVSGGQARAENYALTNAEKDFTITQKEVGLAWSGHENLVYTGNPVSVTATATGLVGDDTCDVTVEDGGKIDAGNYTATAAELSNSNYKLPAAKTQAYTIARAPVSFTVTDNVYDYDADAKSATVAQTADEIPSVAGQFTVSYKKGQNPVDQPTGVGAYEIWVTLNSDNFKFNSEQDAARLKQVGTLTIEGSEYPEQKKISWPEAGQLTYGSPLSESALTGGDTDSKGGAGSFSWKEGTTIPTVTNSGYTVVFSPDDTNYFPVEKTVSITVARKELTINGAAAESRDYVSEKTDVTVSGGVPEGVVTRNGTLDDVALEDSEAAGAVETPDAAENKPVTVTGYAITGDDAGNYTLKQPDDVTVNITPAEGSASVTMEGWTYGETAESPVPVSDTNGTENVSYEYTGTKADGAPYAAGAGVPTDAGTYTVTATFAATQNYRVSTATAAFTIAPKPVMVQWRETSHGYDGAAKSPKLTPVDVAEADRDGVRAVLSGGGKTDAGSYPVTAQLTGDRAFNYTLTNPSGTLLIQKAPVVFTVTDDAAAYDGTAKTAVVTAAANGVDFTDFTLSYRTSAGKVATAPTDVGSYEIWAALGSENYRHADSTGGESRKIGVLTIYQTVPPAKYTVSFAPGEGENITESTDPMAAALPGTLRVLPSCGFARTGWAFAGWKLNGQLYQPGETIEQPARNLTFSAEWTAVVHEIGGMVDQDGSPVKNAVVTLMRGSRYVADTTTDAEGRFVFPSVAPDVYNLVGSCNGVVMTVKVLVDAEDVEDAEIHLPKGKTNSVVEVLAGTPEIVVGNLETAFTENNAAVYTDADKEVVQKGGTVEIKLTAQSVAASDADEAQAVIREKAQNVGLYLDLSLEKTVVGESGTDTTTLTTSGEALLESMIPLPADLQGKYRYAVRRLHDPDGDGPEPPVLESLTETPNEAGEYIEVSGDKTTLTIHAREYSLYAVTWEARPSSGGGDLRPAWNPFVDVKEGAWYYDSVKYVYESGLMLGTGKNTFSPGLTTTRGMIVTILWRLEREPESGSSMPFTDVNPGGYYYEAVRWAAEHGIVNGYATGAFRPDNAVTRQELAAILYRYAQYKGKDVSVSDNLADFTDRPDRWAEEAVKWAVGAGILNGKGGGILDPGGYAARAEAAAMLARFLSMTEN